MGSLLNRYEGYSEAANLGSKIGYSEAAAARAKADKLLARAQKRGLDTSSVDINDFSDPNSLNPNDTRIASQYLGNIHNQQGRKADPVGYKGGARLWDKQNAWQTELGANIGSAGTKALGDQNEKYYQENVQPDITQAESTYRDLAGTDAVSASQEAIMRSNIASMIKRSEASRLNRVGTYLGASGFGDSPAGVALAQRSAEEADAQLTSQLSGQELAVKQMNRDQSRKDADALTAFAGMKMNLRQVRSMDYKALIQMNDAIAQLTDTLYNRNQTLEAERQALRDAGSNNKSLLGMSLLDSAGNFTMDMAKAFFPQTQALPGGSNQAPSKPPAAYVGSRSYNEPMDGGSRYSSSYNSGRGPSYSQYDY